MGFIVGLVIGVVAMSLYTGAHKADICAAETSVSQPEGRGPEAPPTRN